MPIIYQHRVYRCDLRANRHARYLFGDNAKRIGLGGQAGEMRGEPNAIGVATKKSPGMADADFFTDAEFETIVALIAHDLEPAVEHVQKRGVLIIPSDGLGTGLSQLPKRAPRIHAWLDAHLYSLARGNRATFL